MSINILTLLYSMINLHLHFLRRNIYGAVTTPNAICCFLARSSAGILTAVAGCSTTRRTSYHRNCYFADCPAVSHAESANSIHCYRCRIILLAGTAFVQIECKFVILSHFIPPSLYVLG